MRFITKLLEKQFKDSPLQSIPTSCCRDYALRFHWCMYIFYWIQY